MSEASPHTDKKALRIALIAAIAVVAVALVVGLVLAFTGGNAAKIQLPGSASQEESSGVDPTSGLPEGLEGVPGLEESVESSSTTGGVQIDKNKRYVPNVTNLTYAEAARLMKLAGLVPVAKVMSGPTDSDAGKAGIVYRVTPAPGTYVQKGTKVELRYYK